MTGETLVHRAEVVLNGNRYEILVYCRDDGRHFAKTRFGENDIIINDGQSLEAALEKHENLLPLAIICRNAISHVKNGE